MLLGMMHQVILTDNNPSAIPASHPMIIRSKIGSSPSPRQDKFKKLISENLEQ